MAGASDMAGTSGGFDPYYKWLGIPPDEQPPHAYRLLGLKPFESDREVISNAADQRMVHLRGFQAGRNGALSQKILNEVAAARVCLLQPQKKAEYDEALRQTLTARELDLVEVAPVAAPQEPPPPYDYPTPIGPTPIGRNRFCRDLQPFLRRSRPPRCRCLRPTSHFPGRREARAPAFPSPPPRAPLRFCRKGLPRPRCMANRCRPSNCPAAQCRGAVRGLRCGIRRGGGARTPHWRRCCLSCRSSCCWWLSRSWRSCSPAAMAPTAELRSRPA